MKGSNFVTKLCPVRSAAVKTSYNTGQRKSLIGNS